MYTPPEITFRRGIFVIQMYFAGFRVNERVNFSVP